MPVGQFTDRKMRPKRRTLPSQVGLNINKLRIKTITRADPQAPEATTSPLFAMKSAERVKLLRMYQIQIFAIVVSPPKSPLAVYPSGHANRSADQTKKRKGCTQWLNRHGGSVQPAQRVNRCSRWEKDDSQPRRARKDRIGDRTSRFSARRGASVRTASTRRRRTCFVCNAHCGRAQHSFVSVCALGANSCLPNCRQRF
jgi:hypothetical protein